MTEAELADKIADDCGFMKGDCAEIMDRLLDLIKAGPVSGEHAMISAFGKWSVPSKRPNRGRNAHTGREIILDGRRVDTRKYGPVLKNTVSRVLLNHGSRIVSRGLAYCRPQCQVPCDSQSAGVYD